MAGCMKYFIYPIQLQITTLEHSKYMMLILVSKISNTISNEKWREWSYVIISFRYCKKSVKMLIKFFVNSLLLSFRSSYIYWIDSEVLISWLSFCKCSTSRSEGWATFFSIIQIRRMLHSKGVIQRAVLKFSLLIQENQESIS